MPSRSSLVRPVLVVLAVAAAAGRGAWVLPPLGVVLSGCGGGPEPTEIVIWENYRPHEAEVFEECLERYHTAHPDVHVIHTNFETEQLRTQYITAAIGGGGPDLTYGPGDQVGPLSVAGTIVPIDEVFPPEFLDGFLPSAFDTLDGHVWSLPARVGNHLTLLYNRATVRDPPPTLQELARAASEHTIDLDGDGSPDRYGLVFNLKEPYGLVPFLGSYGGWIMDRSYEPTLDRPAMVSALRFARDLKTVWNAMPAECDYELADAIFKEGKAAFLINGPWSWGGYDRAGIDYALAVLPINEETGLWPAPMVSSFGYSLNANVKEKRRERVKDLMIFLTSNEVQLLFARRLLVLPSRRGAHEWIVAGGDERILVSLEQYSKGRRMPVVPEMRAIWDAMRPAYQNVLNGETSPEEAARAMQEDAERKIREMKGL
ncbi:MAG: extracellular solute-binding protein [Candidatus Eisenbacteria bacterium]